MKKLLPLLIAAASLALPASPHAEEAKPKGKGGPGSAGRGAPAERLKMMTEKLGLTDEQQTKIKEIYAKNGPELRELMSKGRENLGEDDKKKVRELMREQMEEIGAVLTPEQKEKMKELRKEAGGRAGKAREAK